MVKIGHVEVGLNYYFIQKKVSVTNYTYFCCDPRKTSCQPSYSCSSVPANNGVINAIPA